MRSSNDYNDDDNEEKVDFYFRFSLFLCFWLLYAFCYWLFFFVLFCVIQFTEHFKQYHKTVYRLFWVNSIGNCNETSSQLFLFISFLLKTHKTTSHFKKIKKILLQVFWRYSIHRFVTRLKKKMGRCFA